MPDEDPGAAEKPLALQPEDLLVVVDVRRDHAAAHIAQHCVKVCHPSLPSIGLCQGRPRRQVVAKTFCFKIDFCLEEGVSAIRQAPVKSQPGNPG